MAVSRKQLSMYIPPDAATDLEAVRRAVDPVQSGLIPAHVTLCREDELGELESIKTRLRTPPFKPLRLRFGRPVAFSGHGLLLECVGGWEQFRALREYLLASSRIRDEKPHITLAHPRNPKARGNSLSNTSALPEVIEVTFPIICLIEQEGNKPWRLLETYQLRRV
ncbi:MAG TPA: 2'-5' RNA ligase family protein [Pyrinomonadaceae bacterium]|nr:2'-5' RNA ligase family protein [Pyrinomonadaceae bacterium]